MSLDAYVIGTIEKMVVHEGFLSSAGFLPLKDKYYLKVFVYKDKIYYFEEEEKAKGFNVLNYVLSHPDIQMQDRDED